MKLYHVSDEYIDYLSKIYKRVFSNKEGKRTHLRKYVGVVLDVNNHKYYIPLSSPKEHDYVIENS